MSRPFLLEVAVMARLCARAHLVRVGGDPTPAPTPRLAAKRPRHLPISGPRGLDSAARAGARAQPPVAGPVQRAATFLLQGCGGLHVAAPGRSSAERAASSATDASTQSDSSTATRTSKSP